MGAEENWGKKGATAQEAEVEQKGRDEGEQRLLLLKIIGKDAY